MPVLQTIDRWVDRIIDTMAALAGLLLLFMMFAICYEVVFRYFLFNPPAWVTEISEYILLYATFLAAPWALKHEAHVKVDLLLVRLSPALQRTFNIATSAIGLAVCAVLIWFGTVMTLDAYRRSIPVIKSLSVPKFLLLMIIPIGAFFLVIQFARRIKAFLNGPTTPGSPPDPGPTMVGG